MVFLVGTSLGGIEKTLRRARSVRVEDCLDGRERIPENEGAGQMVLSPERHDDAVESHAEAGMVSTESSGMSSA